MDYRHFNTSLIGGAVVSFACFAQYGMNAATVIFATKWALVCATWFITTLPDMGNFMRGASWMVFSMMILSFGTQFPYMIRSRYVGEEFVSFVYVMIVFLAALISAPYFVKK